ncbi:MAG: hypothetical protein EZS28_039697, partial [Streblomastix strix]
LLTNKKLLNLEDQLKLAGVLLSLTHYPESAQRYRCLTDSFEPRYGPSFFAQASFISHCINSINSKDQNADHIASIYRSIIDNYGSNQLRATADDAKRMTLDIKASKFAELLFKTKPGDEEDTMENTRQALADSLSQQSQTSSGDEDMITLRFTTDVITNVRKCQVGGN